MRLKRTLDKQGRITVRDILDSPYAELADFAADVQTLVDPESSRVEKGLAVLNIATGINRQTLAGSRNLAARIIDKADEIGKAGGDLGKSPRTSVGRLGQQNNFPNPNAPKPRNAPATINGRDFSGHAIDRMQERGFTPSVIENAIQNGTRSIGKKPGASVFTDASNNLRVIISSDTGKVIMIIPGSN